MLRTLLLFSMPTLLANLLQVVLARITCLKMMEEVVVLPLL